MKTVAIYSLYPRDDIEYFGAPGRRNLARAAAEIAFCMAFMQIVFVAFFRVGNLELLALAGTVLLAFYLLVAGNKVEVAVQPGLLARRTWWQHAYCLDGQLVRFMPGDRIVKMPDGRWLLAGIELSLPNRGRDGRRLTETLTACGLVVEDRQAEWRAAHPRRVDAIKWGIPLGIMVWYAVFGTYAYSDGAVREAMNVFRLGLPVALVMLGLVARAPRTRHQKVAPTVRHFQGPRRHHSTPERLAA